MDKPPLFKWRHFTGEIILCGVRWYLRYALIGFQGLMLQRCLRIVTYFKAIEE